MTGFHYVLITGKIEKEPIDLVTQMVLRKKKIATLAGGDFSKIMVILGFKA